MPGEVGQVCHEAVSWYCKDAAAWISVTMASASEATLQQNIWYNQRLTMRNEEAAIIAMEVTGMLDCYQGSVQ